MASADSLQPAESLAPEPPDAPAAIFVASSDVTSSRSMSTDEADAKSPGRVARLIAKLEGLPLVQKLTTNERLKNVPSLGGSLAFHATLLAIMATWTLSTPSKPDARATVNSDFRPMEELTQWLDPPSEADAVSLTPAAAMADVVLGEAVGGGLATTGGSLSLDRGAVGSGSGAAGGGGGVGDGPGLAGMSVSLADVSLRTLPGDKLATSLGMQSPGDPSMAVGGAAGAIDHITQEMILMLAKGKVQVTWLFDQSESVRSMRDDIKTRVDRVYKELELTTSDDAQALTTVVASYGQELVIHSRKPTADLEQIREQIDQVPADPSGMENVCQAVIGTVARTRKTASQGHRQMVVIVVTDESGDDLDQIDAAIAAARAVECRVYVLGIEASFGNRIVYRTWVDPTTKLGFWLETHLGPETGFDEQLQTDGLWTRRDCQSSGFGPFDLVRLCRETGGIYFILKEGFDSNTVGSLFAKYDNEAMRPYMPDLAAREVLLERRTKDELRHLMGAVVDTLNPRMEPKLNLRDRYPLDLQRFVEAATPEVQKVPFLIAAYDEAEKRMESLRRQRDQEPLPRWQANYDLMYAQVLAFKVRAYEYGAALEAFLKQPSPITKMDTTYWIITTRAETMTGDITKDAMEQARQRLEKIVADYPNTPYAVRARWELDRGFGVALIEDNWDPRHETLGPTIQKPNL